MIVNTEPKMYYVIPVENHENADANKLADGWPRIVRPVKGDPVMELNPDSGETEHTGDFEYADPAANETLETPAEHAARVADPVRLAHNAARKAYEDSKPKFTLKRRQLRFTLNDHGIGDAHIGAVLGAAGQEVRIYWEDTNDFQYDHPVVIQFAAAFGFDTEAKRIAFWHEAKTNHAEK